MSQMKKKCMKDWLQTFKFVFRFGITSLYMVIFGRFPRPKKFNFGPKKWIFGKFF